MRRFSPTLAVATALTLGLLSASLASAGELSPRTKQNLETAMHGEAYANLKYLTYAEMARKSGRPELAALFELTANVEANEHFAREADALKLARQARRTCLMLRPASNTSIRKCTRSSRSRRAKTATSRQQNCSSKSPRMKATTTAHTWP